MFSQPSPQSEPVKLREWSETPAFVTVYMPRCPVCNGVRLLAHRSTALEDDDKVRHCKCADCGQRVLVDVRYRPFGFFQILERQAGRDPRFGD